MNAHTSVHPYKESQGTTSGTDMDGRFNWHWGEVYGNNGLEGGVEKKEQSLGLDRRAIDVKKMRSMLEVGDQKGTPKEIK